MFSSDLTLRFVAFISIPKYKPFPIHLRLIGSAGDSREIRVAPTCNLRKLHLVVLIPLQSCARWDDNQSLVQLSHQGQSVCLWISIQAEPTPPLSKATAPKRLPPKSATH